MIMKRLCFVPIMILSCLGVCAQSQDEEKALLVIKIDSLRNVAGDLAAAQTFSTEQALVNQLKDSVALYRKFEKFAEDKNKYDSSLASKNEQIERLQGELTSLREEYAVEEETMLQRAADELAAGQNASLKSIAEVYLGSSFDDLVQSTSIWSVLRDRELLVSFPEALSIIDDLIVYHRGAELLGRKYDEDAVSKLKERLVDIIGYGDVIEILWNRLDCYCTFVNNIVDSIGGLDSGDFKDEKEAREAFWDRLTSFLHSSDFNFSDYPYLSEILLELIHKKNENPLSDVGYILEKIK